MSQLMINYTVCPLYFLKLLIIEKQLKAFLRDNKQGAFNKKKITTIKAELTTQQAILFLSILSSFLSSFLHALNSLYDVIMRSDAINTFATRWHHLKIFFKIGKIFTNSVYLKTDL